jgi:mRNA-degrading endonuclease toxin of MazEF toxin-antitoxin module
MGYHQIPCRGDFIRIDFDPQSGHEQMGNRPALVVSQSGFNQYRGFALVCPISNTNEFSDRRETTRKLRVFDLRDGDTKTVRNLLAYRKVGLEGGTEELWVPPSFRQRVRCRGE